MILSVAIALLLSLAACITSLDQEPSDFEDYLVVEGFINDDFGPHSFRVSRVSRFAGIRDGGATPLIDADVSIEDQNGQVTVLRRETVRRKDLFNEPPGCNIMINFVDVQTSYRTPGSFKGEVGNTYTLEIRTLDGKVYRSEPQTMQPTPPLEALDLAFKELPSLDDIVKPSGVEVLAIWQDPPEEANYYFWRINGTYRISTSEEGLPGGTCCFFDPTDNKERNCWIIERDLEGNEIAFSDDRVNGERISTKVAFIEDNGLRFASLTLPEEKLYHVEVEHYQVPEGAFNFYQNLNILDEIDGEIFDPPPLSIRGNIFNINDVREPVIGFFGAYSVQKKDIFISKELLKFRQRFTNPCGDCRIRAGAQVEVPEPYQ